MKVIGYADIPLEVGGQEIFVQRLQVLEGDEPTFLLGRDFLSRSEVVTFDWKEGRVRFGNTWIPVISTLCGATPLVRAQTIQQVEVFESLPTTNEFDINPELPHSDQSAIQQMLEEFTHVFAQNPRRPGRTKVEGCEHAILTGDARPIKHRPRRVPPQWRENIQEQVEEMLSNGIIRVSKSPWASDVVLVKKKDGQMRFAVDYRKLNDVTKKDAYALPNPQSILDQLGESKIFSCMDVAAAYWCIPVQEEHVEKTVFYTPRGQFEFEVLPFGLCNSQASFQRLIDQTMIKARRTECYVDDCLTHSPNTREHLRDLRMALECLEKSGLQLRRDKCKFGYWECEFLGHKISGVGCARQRSHILRRSTSFQGQSQLQSYRDF